MLGDAFIIVTNPDGTYDLWDGDLHLLERAPTRRHCTHFMRHGHEHCEDNCPN